MSQGDEMSLKNICLNAILKKMIDYPKIYGIKNIIKHDEPYRAYKYINSLRDYNIQKKLFNSWYKQ